MQPLGAEPAPGSWQSFWGEAFFRHELPIDPSSMTFRGVQPNAKARPTDARRYGPARRTRVEVARRGGVTLRRGYARLSWCTMHFQRTYRLVAVLSGLALLGLPACAQTPAWSPPAYDETFRANWHDGKAELATYDLVYPRYGVMRKGTAVAVTVTEPFRWEPRVKADAAGNGSFNVVKLNLSEDFPTGVYDYNLMTSVFVAAEPVEGLPAGAAVKLTFSSQEWCGQVWQQAVFGTKGVAHEHRSYFEKEADENRQLPGKSGFLAEDALFLWARGLAGPALADGESIELPLYRSAAVSRLRHVPVAWDSVVLTRGEQTSEVRTEALGDIEVRSMFATITREGMDETAKYVFTVEAAPPHRVIQVSRNDGYTLTLRGVSREPYWQQNGLEGEAILENFGLSPRPPATP